MRPSQHIFRVRREYNIWVGNQTLEDYSLRFTAKNARRWSIDRIAKTALGATAFLALEAIAASLTLSYGFANTVIAMFTVAAVIFITGFPIVYSAAKHGLDIDLLTRGAGFGYLGSTITSLIYASFTFIFFAIEAAILASALQALFGIPLSIGYALCAIAVIPIVTHGITAISKFQIGTQSIWLILQCVALGVVVWFESSRVIDWTQYVPENVEHGSGFNLALFGAATSILFALIAQIGEQVDYLRFMPPKTETNKKRWWFWLILAGPGWIFIGLIKMLLGSFLAYIAITRGSSLVEAVDPTFMYQMVFNYLTQSPSISLALAGVMVIISQMKINVTNAYAGSIAWSNFFSRLTHSHPGRVVWLVFNVAIALILMELGVYRALEAILGIFAIVALSWLCCLSADLMINKPLGLSPSYVEFKRAHLYDINPVGIVSMTLASIIGILCYMGSFGETPRHLAHFISIAICFISVPAMALLTKSKYYLARQSPEIIQLFEAMNTEQTDHLQSPVLGCCICENSFEQEDMSYCPAYQGAICSLCCSLDSRCMDNCKSKARFSEQLRTFIQPYLPDFLLSSISSKLAQFLGIMITSNIVLAGLISLIYFHMQPQGSAEIALLKQAMYTLFFILMIVSGVISWLFLLAHESRVVAQTESDNQTHRLIHEIEAHKETDRELQTAKDLAEHANSAKSRYLTGISHELRTPLQSILGYAQLLTQRKDMPSQHYSALNTIKRSGEHLSSLIEGLLDLSKIEAGRLDIYRNTIDFPMLIEELVYMFRAQAIKKGISFTVEINDELPRFVITDEKRLRQILINLLSNALNYTEKGGVEFHINYRNQVAEFSVIDTGIGIHLSDLDRILDPFERVRNVDSPVVSGTGLGLTIVRLLTDIMGGELRITSTPGQGSCFTVSLLLSWIGHPEKVSLPQQKIIAYKGKPKVVMVVDDDPVHRGLMFDLLSPLNFTIVQAHDSHSCYDALEEVQPDIFLMDVSMPGIDGLQLTEQLRSKGYDQAIIIISADATERQSKMHENSSHDEYLVKPINTLQLLARIGQLLKLEWIYAEDEFNKEVVKDAILPIDPVIPAHPLFRELLAYAEIGYKNGISSKLDEIKGADIIDRQTLGTLKQHAEKMQFEKIIKIIEKQNS